MQFEAYLEGKKIDAAAFRQAEPVRFVEWEQLYAQLHPESFTAQKLFVINGIRRKYRLQATKAAAKPMMKMKPKIPTPKIN
jgi:hypothetical protein